jgi:hypothetical protein
MVGETKPRPSPNRLLLTQRECESLIIDPARDSSEREGVKAVFCWPHRSAIHQPVLIHPATGPRKRRLRGLAERIQSCNTTLSSDL